MKVRRGLPGHGNKVATRTEGKHTSQVNAVLIQSLYAAFATDDVGTVIAAMSPDVIWNEAENHPYAAGNPYVGPAAVAQGVFVRLGGEWDGFSVSIEEILAAEDLVIALGRYHGTYKATDAKQNAQMVHAWRVVDGKITSFQQYADTLQIARVIGAV
jgi:uncharacterized protein